MNSLVKLAAAAGFAVFAGLALPAAAQSPEALNARIDVLFGEHTALERAFDALTSAVRAGDAATVASLVKYPFKVTIGGKKTVLNGEADFIARYDAIITSEIADVVADQKYDALFANSEGVMFGDGQMWLTDICTDKSCASSYWAISAINQAN